MEEGSQSWKRRKRCRKENGPPTSRSQVVTSPDSLDTSSFNVLESMDINGTPSTTSIAHRNKPRSSNIAAGPLSTRGVPSISPNIVSSSRLTTTPILGTRTNTSSLLQGASTLSRRPLSDISNTINGADTNASSVRNAIRDGNLQSSLIRRLESDFNAANGIGLARTPRRLMSMTADRSTGQINRLLSSISSMSTRFSGNPFVSRSVSRNRPGVVKELPGYRDMGDPIYSCDKCGAIFWYDERIEKYKERVINPKYTLCCTQGKIKLADVVEPPQEFKDLLYGKSKLSKTFVESIRRYNMSFSFTSMGGKLDNTYNDGRSAPNFRLYGENYHLIGSLLPKPDGSPKFAQLYIYDTDNEIANRIKAARKGDSDRYLDYDVMTILKFILDKSNKLVRAFRTAGERLRDDPTVDLKLNLVSRRSSDGRNVNTPQESEVAMLIVGDIGNLAGDRDIIVESRSGKLSRVSGLHVTYLPVQYPLIYISGEDGFRDDVKHCLTKNSKAHRITNVTLREFCAYYMQERSNQSPHLLFSRRLFQQWLVDAYTMVEAYRLLYVKDHQKDFRSDTYDALEDALARGDTDGSSVGKRVYLPPSFTGGARYMIQNYHDAMAICRWVGYPNLFITFTCNSKWHEIERFLNDRSLHAEDRQDIIARIFHAKLDNLCREIRKDRIFGDTAAVIYTIEFQHRGLPHAHILVWLKDVVDTADPNVVDTFISAELPDKNSDPILFDAVSNYMMHGPCGIARKDSPCMINNTCSKHFPKTFEERTTVDDDGFVKYRRRKDDMSVEKNGVPLDNWFVVPYNPYLLRTYQAHINVEWCNRSRSIKYLFKYVHKGDSRVTAMFYKASDSDEPVDEVKLYYECRYISASEAAWRLLKFEINFREPNVYRLGFHLDKKHNVVYPEGMPIPCVLEQESAKVKMFSAWFTANGKFAKAKELTYGEFPQYFVWNEESKEWTERDRGLAFGRLYYVYPGTGELYYLRMLLNIVRGPESYEDIREYEGTIYATFRDACYARGLLDDDKEFIDAITEASTWGSEHQVRKLFVYILTSDSMSRPEHVWESCWEILSADILKKYRDSLRRQDATLTEDQVKNLCLHEIEKVMRNKNKSLLDYKEMPYPRDVGVSIYGNRLVADEMAYDKDALKVEHEKLEKSLNDEQRAAFNTVIKYVHDKNGGVFFLYGYGGTGKTHVWKTLSAAIRSNGGIVLNVASSGIASLLLPGGRTAHSRFSIPLNPNEESMCNITLQSDLAELIKRTDLIIWDEAPMMNRYCFEALDRSLRDIMKKENPYFAELPFGGKVIVFGGDFCQILPVIPKGSRQDIVCAAINASPIWKHCKVLRLTKNMRLQKTDEGESIEDLTAFSEWLSAIGDGTLGGENDGFADIEIPEDLLITESDDYIRSIVDATYPDFLNHLGDPSYLSGRAILAPTLDEVNKITEYMVAMHGTNERIYLSSDSICTSDRGVSTFEQMHSVEYLNTIKCSGVPNHELRLKVDDPIMLLRNIDPGAGLCNGTRLIVTKLGNYVIEAKVMGGRTDGELVFIPRMTLTPSDPRMPFSFQRRQFPVMVSYAMTINKSQGQSLSNVGIFLRRSVFSHGQFYVAASRVTSRKGLKILVCDENGQLSNRATNVVFKEVFENL